MPTMHTLQGERVLDAEWRDGDLPSLTTIDRAALRLGLVLILWGQRHAERAARAEQARVSRAAERAESSRLHTLEHRAHAGTTW